MLIVTSYPPGLFTQLTNAPVSDNSPRYSPDGKLVALGDGNTTRLYPLDFSVLEADPATLLQEARAAGYEPEAPPR